MGTEGRPEPKLDAGSPATPASGDIVDTFWDIPPIEFPSESGNAGASATTDSEAQSTLKGLHDGTNALNVDENAGLSFPSFDDVLQWPTANSSASSAKSSADNAETAVLGTFPDAHAATQPDAPTATMAMPSVPSADAQSSASAGQTLPLFTPVDKPSSDTSKSNEHDDLNIDFSAIEHNPEPVEEPKHENAGGARAEKGNGKGKIIAISVIAVVAVIAAIVGGIYYWRTDDQRQEARRLHSAALAQCEKAVDEYSAAQEALTKVLSNAKSAQAIKSDQVADGATVTALKKAVSAVKDAETIECKASASTTNLKEYAKTATTQSKTAESNAQAITAAAKAVTDSKNAKDVNDAKQSLQDKITEAQTLLDSSLYAVADDTTRTTLSADVDAANDVLANKSTDVKAMQAAVTTLNTDIDAVNASMAAYTAQQQAAAQAQPDTGYYNGGLTGGNTGGALGDDTGGNSGGNSGDNSGSNGSGNSGSNSGGNSGGNGGSNSGSNSGSNGSNGGSSGGNSSGNSGDNSGSNGSGTGTGSESEETE
ncbi:hypothetical protein [Bifidobacterium olomucense]|uniref:Sugar-binding protein n=1 Tax=Bifidobacterium olomucense TaxID=2675324 RepID=A0A7Y0EYM4_9BIFI|nr:hypothetical protein [Bifidobacterium sp. DSM 109959]NMM98783.1 hypothetical protein [Bifidobacterium sp. DSM 109959]